MGVSLSIRHFNIFSFMKGRMYKYTLGAALERSIHFDNAWYLF
jgi:hypothetical protein